MPSGRLPMTSGLVKSIPSGSSGRASRISRMLGNSGISGGFSMTPVTMSRIGRGNLPGGLWASM